MSELMILVTTPDQPTALQLARDLVERQWVACAQVDGPITSVYRWQDAVHSDSEWRLILKTTQANWDSVRDWVVSHHPYDCPQVGALALDHLSAPYALWLSSQVKS